MAQVKLHNLGKKFGKVEVIKDVNLSIEEGEFVVLIGPSGCGKSTLLRMISGLEDISEGTMLMDGKPVNDVPARDRGISMVFQSYALYPHMTSNQNISFSLKLAGEKPDEQRKKVSRASNILGLDEYLDRYPKQLSGGQRQRVAMGRAIVRKPSLFLFDEPLSNLDAKLRVKMRSELKELHQKLKTTTIYVTHDQIEAMTLADRIIILRDGKVEQIGTPLELYDNPVNSFVGSFLGSPAMNFFNLTADEETPNLAKFADGDTLQVPRDIGHSGPVVLGVRPENILLFEKKVPNGLSAEIVVVEPTGSDTELLVRKADHDITISIRGRLNLNPGDTVYMTVSPEHIHVFDEAGLAIN